MRRLILRSLAGLLLLIVLLAAGALAYARVRTAAPTPEALVALQSTGAVEVATNGWITFSPHAGDPTTGFILYPGGFVDPRAHAPLAHQIAAQGYLVAVPSMPLNLAVLGANRAGDVVDAYPQIQRWAIGGHSLGGAMAAQYAARHPDVVDALVLWAAYPPNNVDLSQSDLAVVSIYGTRDGLVSQADIDDSRSRLPATTSFVPIEGGNHAQFGSYGPQDGDLPAEISAEEQQAQIVAATVAVLAEIDQP